MKGSLANFEKYKPYVAVVLMQIILAGMALFTKAAVGHLKGMKPSVFVVYRQAFSALSIAPFAFFLERRMAAQLSFNLLCKIFFVSLFLALTFNLYAWGLTYATASMAAAASNMVPVITFVLALIFRKESITIKEWHGKAKLLGSIVCVCGAFVYAFVKGPVLNSSYIQSHRHNVGPPISNGQLIKGSLSVLSSTITWSFWIVMQAFLVKQYPSKLRLITIQSFFSSIQAAIWAISLDRNTSSWKLRWNLDLLSVAYCGIAVTGVCFWLRLWAIQKKGPLFTALFTPLTLMITVILSVAIWQEAIRLGSVCGAMLLVVGLYSVLWGKNKEEEQRQVLNGQNSDRKEGNSDGKEENTLECITR